MSTRNRANAADDAAEAFYGQSDTSFVKQIGQICASDPRLLQVFMRTREFYKEQQATRS
ncbi:hypothetical protein [Yoonia sp. BS5-3]|uniref:Uncharacterized protein n=1 Tax=Yoonia phaeophyticola TaxID=3137369 RepID=A0ABZ2V724_9RHOB